jgi:Ammonium Transporter Family
VFSVGLGLVADNHCFFVAQDYRLERKWSAVGFCSGAIAGLVAITPASGFVGSRACSRHVMLLCDTDLLILIWDHSRGGSLWCDGGYGVQFCDTAQVFVWV